MKTYTLPVDGHLELPEIAKIIASEEAGGSQFVGAAVGTSGSANLAFFTELSPGRRPSSLMLRDLSETPPPRSTKVWEGQMIVDGKLRSVAAFRPSELGATAAS